MHFPGRANIVSRFAAACKYPLQAILLINTKPNIKGRVMQFR
jgi:hypothetical protein